MTARILCTVEEWPLEAPGQPWRLITYTVGVRRVDIKLTTALGPPLGRETVASSMLRVRLKWDDLAHPAQSIAPLAAEAPLVIEAVLRKFDVLRRNRQAITTLLREL